MVLRIKLAFSTTEACQTISARMMSAVRAPFVRAYAAVVSEDVVLEL